MFGRELPFDGDVAIIAIVFPRSHFRCHLLFGIDATIQTLTTQHAEFRFSHVHSAAVFRGVVYFQTSQQLTRCFRIKRVIETSAVMSVQVVHDQHDLFRVRVDMLQEMTDELCPIKLCATVRYLRGAFPGQWLDSHEDIGRSQTPVPGAFYAQKKIQPQIGTAAGSFESGR